MKKKKRDKTPNINIGAKYYKYLDEKTILMYRLYKIQNDNEYVFIDEDLNKHKVDHYEFSLWTRLIPDAYIFCNIIDIGDDTNDVLVSLVRTNDIMENGGSYDPFCICRQAYIDPYVNYYGEDDNIIFGISANRDSLGDELMAINSGYKVLYSRIVSIYIDDTLDTILSFIPKAKFDATLYDFANKTKKNRLFNQSIITGLNTSLRGLLEDNCFMSDVRMAFDITRINMELKEIYNGTIEDFELFNSLQTIFNIKLVNPIILKYDHYIDLEKIKREYRLIQDSNDTLYILSYSNGGILKSINDIIE